MADYRRDSGENGRVQTGSSIGNENNEEEEKKDKIIINPEALLNDVLKTAIGTAVGFGVSRFLSAKDD